MTEQDYIIGLVIGISASSIAFILRKNRISIKQTGVKVNAIMIDYVEKYSDNSMMYYPIIEFTTLSGVQISKLYNVGSTFKLLSKGELITIYYLENNPEEFIIDNKKINVIYSVIFCFGILISVIFCYFLILLNKPNLILELKKFLNYT